MSDSDASPARAAPDARARGEGSGEGEHSPAGGGVHSHEGAPPLRARAHARGESFYVTTPIYYVNAAPHLGHAYTTIAADVLARHHRQLSENVFFLTGTDEHGEPVADAAHALGVEPQVLADRNSQCFKELVPRIGASNDFFIRTTDAGHIAKVREVLGRVYDNGYVYKGTYEGWYCPRCADFKAENEIAEGNLCPIHHIALTREQEENYFFALSRLQDRLQALYDEHQDLVGPPARRNEALSFIRSGLRDVPLTRRRLTWGVRVPWDEDHVFYVWFDALLNYYSALSYAIPGEDLTPQLWPADCHLIAKDILRFHAVYWPALLMAAELPLPRKIFVHGYLLMDGEKMSKSLGNVLDPFAVIDRYGSDALRFYLMRDVSFGQDGSVSTTAFEQRYSSELANEYGNLVSRVVAMVHRYRDGVAPALHLDPELEVCFAGLYPLVESLIDQVELSQALQAIWEVVRRLNRYVEEQRPWQLAKEGDTARLDAVLSSLLFGVHGITLLLHPYIPDASAKVLHALGVSDFSLSSDGPKLRLPDGQRISTLSPLFPKREELVA